MFKPALTSLCLLAAAGCVSGDDSPSYLFGLTEQEIVDTAVAIDPDADIDRILWQMEEPFDCDRFADLCADVGADAGLAALETTWRLAYDGADEVTLKATVEAQLADARELWDQAETVDQIAEQEGGAIYYGCSNIEWDYNGRYALRVRAGVTDLAIYISAWVNSRHYKDGSLNRERQCVTGTSWYTSYPWGIESQDIGPKCKTSKKVSANASWGMHGILLDDYRVEGCGSGNGMRACACR